jgi:hypothetical protein
MRTGELNDILKALSDNNNKRISNQELKWLLQKNENDATEIGHAKYGLDEKLGLVLSAITIQMIIL